MWVPSRATATSAGTQTRRRKLVLDSAVPSGLVNLIPGSVLYSSSEPCPLCLTACYWAQVSRLVFGATSYDVATYGFEDLQLYRELATDIRQRSLQEVSAEGTLRTEAAEVLRSWAENFPGTVTPKY